jgi:hypothetical protein
VRAPPEPGAGDIPAAGIPGVHHAAVLDLDPRGQAVGEAELPGGEQPVQILEDLRRRVVGMTRADGEAGLVQAGH